MSKTQKFAQSVFSLHYDGSASKPWGVKVGKIQVSEHSTLPEALERMATEAEVSAKLVRFQGTVEQAYNGAFGRPAWSPFPSAICKTSIHFAGGFETPWIVKGGSSGRKTISTHYNLEAALGHMGLMIKSAQNKQERAAAAE